MSTIDQVIQRSRQPGGFSERKSFSVARQRGIRKMREFALADPHYYILELIQAAIANGASHVHIEVDQSTLTFSYVDGGFARQELAQLFDFLFASKEDFENADIRQLALGVNALMIMEPSRVIVESGDGTLESTDRILIHRDTDTVEVGTPDKALRGTYIRAEGLQRDKISGKSNLTRRDYGPKECAAIENRCLAAPIPLIVNNEPVFGYKAVRTPNIFGYDRVVTFDEGDLYGSIGVPEHSHKESFRLLTRGVWIESTEAAKIDDIKVGGVICYDRLNKTADHAGIVRDERFEELWARIRPYARQVAEGNPGEHTFQLETLDGRVLESRDLRGFLRDHATVVVVDQSSVEGDDAEHAERAAAIGDVLEAPVLKVPEDAQKSVRIMAGRNTRMLEPDLEHADDLAVYRKAPAQPPERPWLTGEVEIPDIPVEDFAEMLYAEESVPADMTTEELVERLGGVGAVEGTIYTPAEESIDELQVRVMTLDRVVWEGTITTPWSGHRLDIRMPAVAPSRLRAALPDDQREDAPPLARLVADVVARHASDRLEKATDRALAGLDHADIEANDNGARLALSSLTRRCLKRLRHPDGGTARVHFSIVDPTPGPNLLEVPLFETLDGQTVSMRDLEDIMTHTGGLVYGVVPEVDPDLAGLDTSRILDLDVESERHLLAIVGEAAYVRVDRRDVLAESGDLAVRDMAVGLRAYPDFPLLAEWNGETADGADAIAAVEAIDAPEASIRVLVEQLTALWRDEQAEPDLRRQAVRHLQWFVCRRRADAPDAPTYGAEDLALFLDGRGRPRSLEAIERAFEDGRHVTMIDGQSADVSELGSTTRSSGESNAEDADETEPVATLMMNAWVARLVDRLGPLRGAFDFDFHADEAREVAATPSEAYLESTTLEGDNYEGRVGLPATRVPEPSIALVDRRRGRTYQLHRPAQIWGMTGFLNIEGDLETLRPTLRQAVMSAGAELVETLAGRLPTLEPGSSEYDRTARALFDFAGRHLRMTRRPDGRVSVEVEHPLAQHILSMPVFPTRKGNPVSAQRLIREFALRSSSVHVGEDDTTRTNDVPDVLADWLDRHLTPHAVVEPAGRGEATGDEPPVPSSEAPFARRLEAALARLHPDDHLRQLGDGDAHEDGELPLRVRLVGIDGEPPTRFANDQPCLFRATSPPTLWVRPERFNSDGTTISDDDFAWALLAAYAHLNELFEPVTNDHELEFQRRVAEAFG